VARVPVKDVRESANPRASPSGHLEQGQSVADGAIREASEGLLNADLMRGQRRGRIMHGDYRCLPALSGWAEGV